MKVLYAHNGGRIPGELTSTMYRHALFVPDENAFGPHRLRVEEATIIVCGEADDNCLLVEGYQKVSEITDINVLFKKVSFVFYLTPSK